MAGRRHCEATRWAVSNLKGDEFLKQIENLRVGSEVKPTCRGDQRSNIKIGNLFEQVNRIKPDPLPKIFQDSADVLSIMFKNDPVPMRLNPCFKCACFRVKHEDNNHTSRIDRRRKEVIRTIGQRGELLGGRVTRDGVVVPGH